MSTKLKLNILSPERKLVSGLLVDSVTLPTTEGQIQILPGHAAIMGQLTTGILRYDGAEGSKKFEAAAISTGFFEVNDDDVTVLAETIELGKEIDRGRATAAFAKAQQILVESELDEHAFKKYQLKLERALIRQQVAAHVGDHTDRE